MFGKERQIDLMRAIRHFGWTLFWLLALAAAIVVLSFAWVAIPAAATIIQGSWSRIWFFGQASYLLAASVVYLVFAIVFLVKRRSQHGASRSGT